MTPVDRKRELLRIANLLSYVGARVGIAALDAAPGRALCQQLDDLAEGAGALGAALKLIAEDAARQVVEAELDAVIAQEAG